jgi:hypothetical protein
MVRQAGYTFLPHPGEKVRIVTLTVKDQVETGNASHQRSAKRVAFCRSGYMRLLS